MTRLAELIDIRHGFAFAGANFSEIPTKDVLLTPGNFRIGGGFKGSKLKYYDGPVPPEYVLTPGDLIVTMTDLSKDMDTLGLPALVPAFADRRRLLHNQRLGLVVIKSAELNSGFLYYVMCGEDYRREVLASSTGTTVHHTSPSRILNFDLQLPPIKVQRRIAAVLSSLDKKIESNRRALDLAERLGDYIFRASAASQLELSKVAAITMGSSPPGTSYNEVGDGLPFYQGTRDFGVRFPSRRVWTTAPVRMAAPNETLLSVRAPVGEVNRAREICCVGRGLAAISSATPSVLFYALRNSAATWEPFQGEGTVFGAINKSDLAKSLLPWPLEGQQSAVEVKLDVIDKRIGALVSESARLVELRDALLPELLSGRLRIPEAQEALA